MNLRGRTATAPTRLAALGAGLTVLALLGAGGGTVANAADSTSARPTIYDVAGTNDSVARTKVARTGVDILSAGSTTTVVATGAQAETLRKSGFKITARQAVDDYLTARSGNKSRAAAGDFPAGDEKYHTYAETTADLQQVAKDHPAIAAVTDLGKSVEGRSINALKIGKNVATDAAVPEVLFTCNQHAREHLTTEMCLRIVHRFTEGYGKDAAITKMVDSHEIYVVPTVNPDGLEYDISGGRYHMWRKNRQDSGTDLNRNWDYKWGCCGGSSGSPNNEAYRGPSAFSAPETTAVKKFVDSRIVGGKQQVKAHIDFHTYSELVMWPFGYTTDKTADGMTRQEYDRFADLGKKMAQSNGYTPQQASQLYITDGSIMDWMWGKHKILSFAFEMYPKSSSPGFYPPDEAIAEQTQRNDGAVDLLVNAAT